MYVHDESEPKKCDIGNGGLTKIRILRNNEYSNLIALGIHPNGNLYLFTENETCLDILSNISKSFEPSAMTIEFNTAFIADASSGMLALSDANKLFSAGNKNEEWIFSDIWEKTPTYILCSINKFIYSVSKSNDLYVYEIIEKATPNDKTKLNDKTGKNPPNIGTHVNSMVASDVYLYLATDYGVQIYNISEKTSPKKVGEIESSYGFQDVALSKNIVYCSSPEKDGGVLMIEGQENRGWLQGCPETSRLVIEDNFLFCAATNDTLYVFDIASSDSLVIDSLSLSWSGIKDLAVKGKYLYALENNQVHVYDNFNEQILSPSTNLLKRGNSLFVRNEERLNEDIWIPDGEKIQLVSHTGSSNQDIHQPPPPSGKTEVYSHDKIAYQIHPAKTRYRENIDYELVLKRDGYPSPSDYRFFEPDIIEYLDHGEFELITSATTEETGLTVESEAVKIFVDSLDLQIKLMTIDTFDVSLTTKTIHLERTTEIDGTVSFNIDKYHYWTPPDLKFAWIASSDAAGLESINDLTLLLEQDREDNIPISIDNIHANIDTVFIWFIMEPRTEVCQLISRETKCILNKSNSLFNWDHSSKFKELLKTGKVQHVFDGSSLTIHAIQAIKIVLDSAPPCIPSPPIIECEDYALVGDKLNIHLSEENCTTQNYNVDFKVTCPQAAIVDSLVSGNELDIPITSKGIYEIFATSVCDTNSSDSSNKNVYAGEIKLQINSVSTPSNSIENICDDILEIGLEEKDNISIDLSYETSFPEEFDKNIVLAYTPTWGGDHKSLYRMIAESVPSESSINNQLITLELPTILPPKDEDHFIWFTMDVRDNVEELMSCDIDPQDEDWNEETANPDTADDIAAMSTAQFEALCSAMENNYIDWSFDNKPIKMFGVSGVRVKQKIVPPPEQPRITGRDYAFWGESIEYSIIADNEESVQYQFQYLIYKNDKSVTTITNEVQPSNKTVIQFSNKNEFKYEILGRVICQGYASDWSEALIVFVGDIELEINKVKYADQMIEDYRTGSLILPSSSNPITLDLTYTVQNLFDSTFSLKVPCGYTPNWTREPKSNSLIKRGLHVNVIGGQKIVNTVTIELPGLPDTNATFYLWLVADVRESIDALMSCDPDTAKERWDETSPNNDDIAAMSAEEYSELVINDHIDWKFDNKAWRINAIRGIKITCLNAATVTDITNSIFHVEKDSIFRVNCEHENIVATLNLRKGGEDSSQYVQTPMERQESDIKLFSKAISHDLITERGLEYYIQLKINDKHFMYLPTGYSPSEPKCIQVEMNSLTSPFELADKFYQMISLPFDLNNKLCSTSFSKYGFGQNSELKIYRYLPSSLEGQSGQNVKIDQNNEKEVDLLLTPGSSFWIAEDEGQPLKFDSLLSTPTEKPYIIALKKGWNQVANPFAFNINWDDPNCVGKTNIASPKPWIYITDGITYGEYHKRSILEPWMGYFIYADDDNAQLIINPEEYQVPLNKSINLSHNLRNLENNEWLLQLRAKTRNTRDSYNYIGVMETASTGWDLNEEYEPPVAPMYTSLYFEKKDWAENSGLYTTDFKPMSNTGYIWDFFIISNQQSEVITLSIVDSTNFDMRNQMVLTDHYTSINETFNLGQEYQFLSNSNGNTKRHFSLLIGSQDFINSHDLVLNTQPTEYKLAQNYPNPFNAKTCIEYALAQKGKAKLTVYNINGQEVEVLVDGLKDIGHHRIFFDGIRYPAGVYYYRLETDHFCDSKKMIFLK